MSSVVLVDGSNVARCEAWRRHIGSSASDHDLRRALVDAVASWAPMTGVSAVVAFDGAGPWQPGIVQVTPDVEVEGTGAASGDDVLERRAVALRATGTAHWIVTSDIALRQVAGCAADRVLDSDSFVVELLRGDDAAVVEPPAATSLGSTLDDDVRARLERMRRGYDL